MSVQYTLGCGFLTTPPRSGFLGVPSPVWQKYPVRPSIDQIREDIAACEKIGAEEVILEVGFTLGGQSLTNWQKLLEEFPPARAAAAS